MLHVQSDSVAEHIDKYERHLADSGLPDIPFHAGPLFNGHDGYEDISFADRKRLFFAFVFCQIFVGRFGVSFSPFERLFLGRFGFGQSCGLSVIA